ncbi:MAG: VWA domain-containing protein [Anaerobacillus sp.]
MGLQLDNPLWLTLLLPVFISMYLYRKQAHSSIETWLLFSVRSLLFIFISLALSGLQIVTPIQGVSTIFVADRSDSIENQEGNMSDDIQRALKQSKESDRYGLVSVGKEGEIENSLQTFKDQKVSFQNVVTRDATDLASGLSLGASLLKHNDRGRIVLMTDGNETIHDSVQRAEQLSRQGIRVDVMGYAPEIGADAAITQFTVPDRAYQGEQASIELEVESNHAGKATIRIAGETEVVNQNVTLEEGTNRFTFKDDMTESGFREYKAEVIAENDSVSENNEAHGISIIKGQPQVLLVEGNRGQGDNLNSALKSTGLSVTKITPELLPTTLSGIAEYQSIVFANVSGAQVSEKQMNLIESAVRDFGTGFIMSGGSDSFGLGGYFKTPIERILPVDMDVKGKKEIPSLGMVMVLDRSGSMTGYKLDLAKEAAARSVELLREEDTFGFIAFDDQPWEIIETSPIKDKKTVIDQITSLTSGGGTEIFASLSMAYEKLSPLELKRKHIILLTDGQANNQPDYQSMIEEASEREITLSTVAIGADADRTLLNQLAEYGEGRFYDVSDVSTIPSILSRETALTTRTYIEDNPFFPVVRGDELRSYVSEGTPRMNAYLATTAKSRAEVLLESQKEDPVLARWRYGLGKTIAWTSDLTGEWSGEWALWDQWAPMWNELVTSTFPQYEGEPYDVSTVNNGGNVTVTLNALRDMSGNVKGKILDRLGKEVPSKLRQVGPDEFELTFQAHQGVYFAQLEQEEAGEVLDAYQTGIVIPYGEEYRPKPINSEKLLAIAKAGGGQVLSNEDNVFDRNIPKQYERHPIQYILLLITLFLFMLDVAIRRFGLRRIKRKERKKSSKKDSSSQERIERLKTASKKKKTQNPVSNERIIPQPAQIREEKPITYHSEKSDHNERLARLLEAKNKRKK